jgi:hypothetical protein
MATLSERLTEAEQAYHDLQTGRSVVEFRDQNGEMMRYSQATKGSLFSYITRLQTQLGRKVVSGPMGFLF